MISAPALGGLFGVGFVLAVGLVVQRSKAREHERRLAIIRKKIERRRAQLADPARDPARQDRAYGPTESSRECNHG